MAACIALLYQCRELAKNQKTDTKKPRISTRLYMFGAGTKSRTRDLLITSQLLYQLSYTGNGGYYIYYKRLVNPFCNYF